MKRLSLLSAVVLSSIACAGPSHASLQGDASTPSPTAAPAPAPAPPASSRGAVSGVVTDITTSEPIEGAIVVLSCSCLEQQLERITNARGVYSFTELPSGNYTVQVLAGKANISKISQLPRGAKFRANFRVNPNQDTLETIVVEASPVNQSTETSMHIGMDQAKNLPVGNNSSRDFTTLVDISPTASRDAAGISLGGGSGVNEGEGYAELRENGTHQTKRAPVSTFSIDVDTASYSNVRRMLEDGYLPPAEAVRAEELINYFSYDYPAPPAGSPFSVVTEVSDCPWKPNTRLLHIGLQGQKIASAKLPPRNLVFLLDVSGSMNSPDKLPLLVRGMKLLVSTLGKRDRVSIVVYAGAAGVVLPPTSGARQSTILAALDRLSAGGSTAGAAGIEQAYALARQQFDRQGINRVILATDGDFNVGISDEASLQQLIEHERESGVFLSVLGFGTGNLQDAKMELLADKGNGNYAYIDSLAEARKVLVEEGGANLVTIAKDVKLQLEFDPKQVRSYRLVGYENRMLAAQDFDDDRKDAGEIGAGHSVTALYELELAPKAKTKRPLAELRLRHKAPQGSKSVLTKAQVYDRSVALSKTSEDFRFAAAVAEFALLLRGSKHARKLSWAETRRLAKGALGKDPGGYRRDFLALIDLADGLDP